MTQRRAVSVVILNTPPPTVSPPTVAPWVISPPLVAPSSRTSSTLSHDPLKGMCGDTKIFSQQLPIQYQIACSHTLCYPVATYNKLRFFFQAYTKSLKLFLLFSFLHSGSIFSDIQKQPSLSNQSTSWQPLFISVIPFYHTRFHQLYNKSLLTLNQSRIRMVIRLANRLFQNNRIFSISQKWWRREWNATTLEISLQQLIRELTLW